MSDDVVGRCCYAFWSQTCEPGQEQDRARKALVSPMQAALAALKPGDKVGDGCVVVPVELVKAANQLVNNDGWVRHPYMDEQVYEDGGDLQDALAALDTGETE